MVISGATAEVSVGTLFLGGFIPGVLMGSHLAHFGLILVLNLMIGVATPPAGLSLFVVSEAQDIRLERPMRECIAADLPLPPAA
jgi:TRAP-type C4-dicarboxylate transport system permease large subunit